MTKPDAYRWRAHLRDGQVIAEAGSFNDLPAGEVWRLELIPHSTLLRKRPPVSVVVPVGAQAVCFRRRHVTVDLNAEAYHMTGTLTCIGWQQGESAVHVWVTDDGSVEVTT